MFPAFPSEYRLKQPAKYLSAFVPIFIHLIQFSMDSLLLPLTSPLSLSGLRGRKDISAHKGG